MACFATTAVTSSDCHLNAVLLLKNKPLFHIGSLFHIAFTLSVTKFLDFWQNRFFHSTN